MSKIVSEHKTETPTDMRVQAYIEAAAQAVGRAATMEVYKKRRPKRVTDFRRKKRSR